jgi:hypothetical protein
VYGGPSGRLNFAELLGAETAARIFTEIKLEQGIPEAISATPVRRLSTAP